MTLVVSLAGLQLAQADSVRDGVIAEGVGFIAGCVRDKSQTKVLSWLFGD
jgi:hypothetical protein